MIAFLLLVYGVIIGSFLNALVWRLRKKRDWVRERSECTHCHHTLAAKDLVPVLSWLYLKGRCRYCVKKIDDSPLTELGLGLLFAASYLFWPHSFTGLAHIALFIVWLIVLGFFVLLAVYDFRWFMLPDKFTYALIPIAVLFSALRFVVEPSRGITQALVGGVVSFGIFYILFQVSKGQWIGGGDVKIAFSLGLLGGSFGASIAIIFVSSLLGTVYALPIIIKRKRLHDIKVPYGPFLMLATVLVVLFYEHTYTQFLAPVFAPF